MIALVCSIPSWAIPLVLLVVGTPSCYWACGGRDRDVWGLGQVCGFTGAVIYVLVVGILYFAVMHIFF